MESKKETENMNTKADQILEHIIELKTGQGEVKADIRGIKEHLERLNGTVREHEQKIGSIRITMAKWLGGGAVIIALTQIALKLII